MNKIPREYRQTALMVSWALEALMWELRKDGFEADYIGKLVKELRSNNRISGESRLVQDRFAFAINEARLSNYEDIRKALFCTWREEHWVGGKVVELS